MLGQIKINWRCPGSKVNDNLIVLLSTALHFVCGEVSRGVREVYEGVRGFTGVVRGGGMLELKRLKTVVY